VTIKQRNPRFGCPQIALLIANRFGIEINKDVVRRVLEKHYHLGPGKSSGPSWLSFIGNSKDSLWSIASFLLGNPLQWTFSNTEYRLINNSP